MWMRTNSKKLKLLRRHTVSNGWPPARGIDCLVTEVGGPEFSRHCRTYSKPVYHRNLQIRGHISSTYLQFVKFSQLTVGQLMRTNPDIWGKRPDFSRGRKSIDPLQRLENLQG
jgi:hypothetical protein